jgi:phosphoserine phosphatase
MLISSKFRSRSQEDYMKTTTHFLALVAATALPTDMTDLLAPLDLPVFGTPIPLHPTRAVDIPLAALPDVADLRTALDPHQIDFFVTTAAGRLKKLLLADMDSTMITGETLDEIAGHWGVRDQVAGITARAMAGTMDYRAAMTERLALIKGLPQEILAQVLGDIRPSPGAKTLIATARKMGLTCVLISGGFTFFTAPVAEKLGFHHHHGNTLDLVDGKVSGTVHDPLIHHAAKLEILHDYCARLHLTPDDVAAIGDGANDLPMLSAAGLGLGYHPKPLLREHLNNLILHTDLTSLLYAMGVPHDQFVSAP